MKAILGMKVKRERRGMTLPLIAISMTGLCGFVALAVDVGRVAVAKVQAQTAADVAAMAGARTLNGTAPQTVSAATASALSAAGSVPVLGQSLTGSNIVVTHGTYRYDPTAQKFNPQFSLNNGELYNLTQVTVNVNCTTAMIGMNRSVAWIRLG